MELLGLTEKRTTALCQPLRRPAPAAVDRAGADRQPRDRDPRRAHHRPRSAGAARDLAADRVGSATRGVTVVLVTHFMEEAERLCDRVALLHRGRVAVIDTPAGLASGTRRRAADQLPSPSRRGRAAAARCPTVIGDVVRHGDRITITGTGRPARHRGRRARPPARHPAPDPGPPIDARRRVRRAHRRRSPGGRTMTALSTHAPDRHARAPAACLRRAAAYRGKAVRARADDDVLGRAVSRGAAGRSSEPPWQQAPEGAGRPALHRRLHTDGDGVHARRSWR